MLIFNILANIILINYSCEMIYKNKKSRGGLPYHDFYFIQAKACDTFYTTTLFSRKA
jgi:hypothetical protein